LRKQITLIHITALLVLLLALAACATTGTVGNGDTMTPSNTTETAGSNTAASSDIPSNDEPLASGTPVMYEFYSDT